MECRSCKKLIEDGPWNFCPFCGVPSPCDVPQSVYGDGVRKQVFEVIVRQAMAGADWKENCANPMQVNGISQEEVEAEVKRRGLINALAHSKPSHVLPVALVLFILLFVLTFLVALVDVKH